MADKDTTEPKATDPKKLVMAIIETLNHRHGRPPTADEIAAALSDEPKQAQELEKQEQEVAEQNESEQHPKILSFKIFYGMKTGQDGTRTEAPDNPLFYGDEERNRWFDVHNGNWLTEKPHIVDSLPCRELGDSDSQKDLFDAIINGVMDQEDYDLLSQSHDLLDPRCHKAFKLVSQLHQDTEDLNKALLAKSEEEGESLGEGEIENTIEGSTDALSEIMDGAGVASSDRENGQGEPDELVSGADLPQEIKAATLSPGVEYRVRLLIQQEISAALDMIRQEIYSALQMHNPTEEVQEIDPDGVDFTEDEGLDL